jgi:hypothetical protein
MYMWNNMRVYDETGLNSAIIVKDILVQMLMI